MSSQASTVGRESRRAGPEARGTILGRVGDASGAVIPGVRIKIVSQATNVAIAVTRYDQGNCQAPSPIPGAYRVTTVSEGFKNYVRGGVELQVDNRLEIDIAMEPGLGTETVPGLKLL